MGRHAASLPAGPSSTSIRKPDCADQNRRLKDSCAFLAASETRDANGRLPDSSESQLSSKRSALYQRALISTALPRRGVTTQSPTLASIQVSAYAFRALRQQPVARIHADSEVRAPHVMFEDVHQLGQHHFEHGPIAGHFRITIDGVEKPKRGVGGVIQPFVLSFREQIGNQSVADVVCERPAGSRPLPVNRPVLSVMPSSEIMVSRPQSVNQ